MNNFHPGEQITMYLSSCASSSGGIVDPEPLYFTYWAPNSVVVVAGTSAGSALTTGNSSGLYYYRLTPTTSQTGYWHYRWHSTGTYPLAQWGTFKVAEPPRST